MSESSTTILIMVGFVIFFPLLWVAIVRLVAYLGGWAKLARYYSADGEVLGDRFAMSSARFGKIAGYNSTLNITVTPQGLHLQTVFLFRTGHVPLFIPWDDFLDMTRTHFAFRTSIRMTISGENGGTRAVITVFGKSLADSLQKHAPPRLVGDWI